MNKLSIIFLIVLIASICIPFYPVSADTADKYAPVIGVKQVKDNNIDITYIGNHSKDSKGSDIYEYQATIYSVDIYTDSGSMVDCSWHTKQEATQTYDNKSGKTVYTPAIYEIKNNTFSVIVNGTQVTTAYNGEWLSWNPVVYVDSKQYTAISNASKKTDNSKNVLNINYGNNILEWNYEVCTRRITITEGKITEEYIFDKDPKGNVWIKDNATQSQGFEWEVMPYAYDSNMKPIEINEYKQVSAMVLADAKYPVVIDPTVNYGAASYSSLIGWNANYNTAWDLASATYTSPSWLGQALSGGYYGVMRFGVVSDTSGLPDDCTITAAYIYITCSDYSTDDFYISVYGGSSSTYPHNPVVAGDYDRDYTGTYYGQTWYTSGSSCQINLNAAGLAAISKTGVSKYYLRSASDIAAAAPDTLEYVSNVIPYLYVTYTASAVPTVTTSAASSVGETSCQGNGEVTADNGDVITRRGFCYKVGTSGDPTTADSVSYDDGSWNEGTFFKTISGLSGGTSYRVRAYAVNSAGTGYGSTVQILTKPAAPTSVSATDGTYTTKVVVTWTKSTGATGYYIYQGGVYLATVGDVATYDDTTAGAPTITAGTASASDGLYPDYVTCSIGGESASNGASRTYTVYAYNTAGTSSVSNSNTGYRGTTTLTYQWYRSAADSDASYSSVGGGTTDPYNDTGAPTDGTGRYWKCLVSMTGATSQYTTANRGYRINVPTVTTNDATYITKSRARLNGYLDADGGETCNVSFRYALWNGSAWEANVSTSIQTGKVTGNSFYADLSGLTNNSTYRFIAVAENTAGEDIGAWLNLTTLDTFSAPTDLTCQATSSNILLSWIKSDSSQVYIRYKIGSYPTDYTDGNVIANQSTNSYIHTSLTSGTSYYYKVWGLEGGNLSTTNSTCICTTTAGYTSGTTNPLPTANTSGWNETPNGSVLENNPLYAFGNMQADEVGMPHNTWWLLIGIGAIVVFGIFTYTRTKDLLIAMVVVIVIGVIVAQTGIFPLWTMYIFGVTGLGFSWKELR